MQLIMQTVPDDTAFMLAAYLACCLGLMYLLIRVDSAWNRREINLSHERMRLLESHYRKHGRLQALTACSAHHELHCVCFLHEKKMLRSLQAETLEQ